MSCLIQTGVIVEVATSAERKDALERLAVKCIIILLSVNVFLSIVTTACIAVERKELKNANK